MRRFLTSLVIFLTNYLLVPIAFFLPYIIVVRSLNPFLGITSYGDISYLWGKDFIAAWSQHLANGFDISLSSFLYTSQAIAIKVFLFIGLNNNFASYLVWITAPLFCFIVSFYAFKRITNNLMLTVSLCYLLLLGNESIEYILYFPREYYFLIGVLIYSFYEMSLLWEGKTLHKKDFILLTLISLLPSHPFFILILLLSWLIFIVLQRFINGGRMITKLLILLPLSIVFINFYWEFSFICSLLIFKNSAASIYSNVNLSAVYSSFRASAHIQNVLEGWTYPTIQKYRDMFSNPITRAYNLVLLLISIICLMKSGIRKFTGVLTIIAVFFLSLSFAPSNPLIANIWNYLWDNFGFFSFFRTFPRFSVILIPIYSFILVVVTKDIKKHYKNILALAIFLVLFISNKYLWTGDLGGALVNSFLVPNDYYVVNKMLHVDKDIYSVLRFPNPGYEVYAWNKSRATNVFPQTHYFAEFFFDKPLLYDKAAIDLKDTNKFYDSIFSYNYPRVIHQSTAKYIMVSKDMVDLSGNSVDWRNYYDLLINDPLTKKVYSGDNLALFANSTYLPLIFGTNVEFTHISDTQYSIKIKNVKNTTMISFLSNYNPNWKLYLSPVAGAPVCVPIATYLSNTTTECANNISKNTFSKYLFLTKSKLLNIADMQSNDYANSWTIDSSTLPAKFPNQYYTVNSDGSIDLSLMLFYTPQLVLVVGQLVSVMYVLLLLFVLVREAVITIIKSYE